MTWNPAGTGIAACGNVLWTLGMASNSDPIDSAIFNEDFASATKSLAIYSMDLTKLGLYDFLVTAYYDINPTVLVTE